MTDFFNVGAATNQGILVNQSVNKTSADLDQMQQQTLNTMARTEAQNLANTEAQKKAQLKTDTDKGLVNAWTPVQPVQAPTQQQAPPPPTQQPYNPNLQPSTSLGQLAIGGQQPQAGQYAPGTLQTPNNPSNMAVQPQSQAVSPNAQPNQQGYNFPNVQPLAQHYGQAPNQTQTPAEAPQTQATPNAAPQTAQYTPGTLTTPLHPDITHPEAALAMLNPQVAGPAINTAATPEITASKNGYAPVQVTPGGTFNRDAFIQHLIDTGHGEEAMSWQDHFKLVDNTAVKAKLENQIAFGTQVATKAAAIESLPDSMKPAAYTQARQELIAMGVPPESLPINYDPKFVQSEAAEATKQTDKWKQQHEVAQDNIATLTQNATQQHQIAQEQLMAAAQKETNRHNLQEEAIERQKIAQGLGVGGSDLVGNAFLNTLPQTTQNYLHGAAIGEIPVNPRSKEGQAVIKAASQAYPDVNIAGATKFTQELGKVNAGTSGGVAVGSNKTLEHIDTMANLDTGAGAGTDSGVPNVFGLGGLANRAWNAVTNPKNENAWNAAHAATVNEMARSFKGGPPGESETARDMKNLKYSDPVEYKNKVYQAYANLLQGQTGAVESQRQQVYGSADPGTSLLTTKSQQVLKKLNGGKLPTGILPAYDDPAVIAKKAGQQGNMNAGLPTSPNTAIQEGQTATGPNGKITYTKGQWLDANGKVVQ